MKKTNQKTSKYQYLAGNIALFSVSNFVSKILVFLLVPLYTNVLTTYEYGIADILQVTLLLLVPAVTVNMGEAALRFGIENIRETFEEDFLRLEGRHDLLEERLGRSALVREDAHALVRILEDVLTDTGEGDDGALEVSSAP